MFILLALQFIYTVVCIYLLMKKLNTDVSNIRKILYAVFSFIILTGAFCLPLILNNYDTLTRNFILYLGVYFITMALLFPDEFIDDKKRTTTMKLSNFILYYYVVVYLPIMALNIANTLKGVQVIGLTLLIVIIVLTVVLGLRFLERKIRDSVNEKTIAIFAVLVVLGGFLLIHRQIGQVDISNFDTRRTNEIFFDDDSYIAEEYSFYIRELGSEIFDFATDDENIYLLSSTALVDTLYVSIIDKEDLTVQKTYEFYPENDKYTWFIHLEKDFIFNQNGTIYFTFIDGIYTINDAEATKISDIGDQESYKFITEGLFHIAVKEESKIDIYNFSPTGLNKIDSIDEIDGEGYEVNSINNYLTLKDKTENTILLYPDITYSIPDGMTNYPILLANDNGIILSNDLNPLVLEFEGQYAKFDYYFISKDSTLTHVESDDYMFGLRQVTLDEKVIVYETFPTPNLYDYEFKDVIIPDKFIHNMFGSTSYSLKNTLVKKGDSLYGIYYKIGDFTSNQIYIEINEVKSLSKTYDLGFLTEFSKEAYMATFLITLAYAGNFVLKKKGDYIPKHR